MIDFEQHCGFYDTKGLGLKKAIFQLLFYEIYVKMIMDVTFYLYQFLNHGLCSWSMRCFLLSLIPTTVLQCIIRSSLARTDKTQRVSGVLYY